MNEGLCRLCGEYKKLSFEHIPPKRAFNNKSLLLTTIEHLDKQWSPSQPRQGLGKHTLCESCNKKTGSWYGNEFVKWTKQGMEWFDHLRAKESIYLQLPFYICPLNVLKQIMVMALAMSSAAALNYHYDLRKFVLSKEQRYFPKKYAVHVYFQKGGKPRFESDIGIMKIDGGYSSYVEAEVALPPFGYCVSTNVGQSKSLADYQGLYDITWFSEYRYDEWSPVYLKLPKLETHGPVPLDYRTKAEQSQPNEDFSLRV
jgi:hypothetical protein